MQKCTAIIGAGVSGLTCGILFAETGWKVTIFAAETGPNTTSAVAGAIWFPYDAEPANKIIPWALTTYERLLELSHDSKTGVSMIEICQFTRSGEIPIPAWAKSFGAVPVPINARAIDSPLRLGVARQSPSGAARFSKSRPVFPNAGAIKNSPERNGISGNPFTDGYALTVPLTDTTIYLSYLADRFRKSGGTIQSTHITKLEEVPSAFGLIVNCAGIGARELVPDPDLEPHRGQVVIVSKLNLSHAIVCDDSPLMYAIPRVNDCVFGGTNSIDDSREPSLSDTDAIVSECSRTLGIEPPQVTAVKVGLRPFRKSGVRLESERLADRRTVIHNYGHGGAGFTLSWSCAEEVLGIASAS